MAMGLEPAVDTFEELNAGSTDGIRGEFEPAGRLTRLRRGTPIMVNWRPTELIGMDIGGPGVLDADDGRAAKRLPGEWGRNGRNGAADTPGLRERASRCGTTITGADGRNRRER